jgi:Ca2+/Na+ antiporter
VGNVFPWIGGGIASVMGIVALFMVSRTSDPITAAGGLIFFLFCALYTFYLIKRGFDRAH